MGAGLRECRLQAEESAVLHRARPCPWDKVRDVNCECTTEHTEAGGGTGFPCGCRGRLNQQGQEAGVIHVAMD